MLSGRSYESGVLKSKREKYNLNGGRQEGRAILMELRERYPMPMGTTMIPSI
jgi:hypothetical protein